MNMNKLAIIGAGKVARIHAEAIRTLPNVKLLAVADINESAAKTLSNENGCKYFTNVEQMLDEIELNAAIICLPTFLHAKYVTMCAKHGVNVLCEKPIEITVKATEEMLKAVKESGIIFMVGQGNKTNV